MRKEKDVLVLEKSINPSFIFFILVVLLLVGGSIYYYHTFFNNPAYIIKSSIKKYSEKNDSKTQIDLNKPIKIHGGIEFDFKAIDEDKQKMYDVFNNIDFLYNIESDIKNNILSAKINSKYEKESLLNGKLYYEKDNIYLFLDDFYNKYIKFNKESNDLNTIESVQLTDDEIETFAAGFMKVLTNAFSEDDFHRENDEILIDDKKVEVYKNYVVYNKNNFKEVNERIIKSIKENNEFSILLKKLIGDDLYNKFLNKLTNMKNIGDFSGEFVIYTKGYNNQFVKMALNLYNKDDYMMIELNNNDAVSISVLNDQFDFKITLEKNEQENYIINLSLIMEDESNINIKISIIMENIEDIDKIDEKNIVSYDKLSEEEINNIIDKIKNNKTIKSFTSDFKNVVNKELNFSM